MEFRINQSNVFKVITHSVILPQGHVLSNKPIIKIIPAVTILYLLSSYVFGNVIEYSKSEDGTVRKICQIGLSSNDGVETV